MWKLLAINALMTAAPAKKSTSSSSLSTVLLLAVLFGAVYFVFIRPRQQRQRQAQLGSRKYEIGDEIQTVGGLIGTVVAEDGDRVTVSTGKGHELVFLRAAIQRKITPPDPVEPDHDAVDDDTDGPLPGFSDDTGAGEPAKTPTEEPEKK